MRKQIQKLGKLEVRPQKKGLHLILVAKPLHCIFTIGKKSGLHVLPFTIFTGILKTGFQTNAFPGEFPIRHLFFTFWIPKMGLSVHAGEILAGPVSVESGGFINGCLVWSLNQKMS